MSMELRVVDAFTDQPFAGNPAAVAVLDSFPEEPVMQKIAREMNLAETAFVVARPDGDFDLRWFTPTVEVELCGHATLAAAHVLGGAARFHTLSGLLGCRAVPDGWIEMEFPSDPVEPIPVPDLGIGGVKSAHQGKFDILVELADAAAVRTLQPDMGRVAAVPSRGVIFTAPGDRPGLDCVSRMFAPNVGIAEDPVTGSAHCTLAGFWSTRTGRTSLVGEQASPRSGVVRMRVQGERVVLAGQAVTVSKVRLLV